MAAHTLCAKGHSTSIYLAIVVVLLAISALAQVTLPKASQSISDPATSAKPPGWQWTVQAGGSNPEIGNGVAQDNLGNVYVTGNFSVTASFGDMTVNSNGGEDAFIAKYNSDGAPQWVRNVGGDQLDSGNDLAVDAMGNVYVAGGFSGTATFGEVQLKSSGSRDGFVVKYDTAGTLQWAQKIGGAGDDFAQGIAADPAGNVYATGLFEGSLTFDATALASNGSAAIFLIKFNTNGSPQWAKQGTGPSLNDLGWDVAADAAGNAFVSGRFLISATFDKVTLNSLGQEDIFVAKYDSAGTLQWAKQAGSPSSDDGYAIGADGKGGCYVTGRFGGPQGLKGTFGSISLTGSGGSDIFVAKYDAAGNVVWAEGSGGPGNDEGRGIEADDAGNCYVTGAFARGAAFSKVTAAGDGPFDLFIAKYSPTGAFQWLKQMGENGGGEGEAISVEPRTARIAVTGRFNGTVSSGMTSLTANNTDALIATTASSCPLQPIRLFNTGATVDGQSTLPANQVDPHYLLRNTLNLPQPVIVLGPTLASSSWLTNGPKDVWIGPATNISIGIYTYSLTFDLPESCDTSKAIISGRWSSDNETVDILLNGVSTGFHHDPSTDPEPFKHFMPFVIQSGFRLDTNRNILEFRVRNRVSGSGLVTPTGFRVELSGSIPCCACGALPGGLLDWWPFDETSGTNAQDIRGLINNVGRYASDPTPARGVVGGALCFDGLNDSVEVTNNSEINFPSDCGSEPPVDGPFTIDAWVRTDDNVGVQTILEKRAQSGGYRLFLDGPLLGFRMADGPGGSCGAGSPFPCTDYMSPSPQSPLFVNVASGDWHFVAVTVTKCPIPIGKMFIDGNLVLTFTPRTGSPTNAANLQIGRPSPGFGDRHFRGCIDELEFFKRVLKEDEIRNIFEANGGGKCFRQPCPAITFNPAVLVHPIWSANVDYPSLILAPTGGAAPYTLTVSGLPPGMILDPDGTLHGKPTTPGSYVITITVADAHSCLSVKKYAIKIITCTATIALNPAAGSLQTTGINLPYLQTFTATGGCGSPFTYAATGGALPPGLALQSNGLLVGLLQQPGIFTFTVTATDGCGCSKSQTYRVRVDCRVGQLPLFNTGVADNGVPLPTGATDDHYTSTLPNGDPGATQTTIPPSTWVPDSLSSKWIVPLPGARGMTGETVYRIRLLLTGCDPGSVVITGSWAAVNDGFIRVNGGALHISPTPSPGFGLLTQFTLNNANSAWVPGVNTIEFVVNSFSGASALRVELTGRIGKCCPC